MHIYVLHCAYIHTYMHTYIHMHIRTYIHSYPVQHHSIRTTALDILGSSALLSPVQLLTWSTHLHTQEQPYYSHVVHTCKHKTCCVRDTCTQHVVFEEHAHNVLCLRNMHTTCCVLRYMHTKCCVFKYMHTTCCVWGTCTQHVVFEEHAHNMLCLRYMHTTCYVWDTCTHVMFGVHAHNMLCLGYMHTTCCV